MQEILSANQIYDNFFGRRRENISDMQSSVLIGIRSMNTSIIIAETSSLNGILPILEIQFASGMVFHLEGKYYIVSLEI
jgi:hypothetical protein